MDDNNYKVIFSGITDPDKNRTDVTKNFADKARLSIKQAEKIFSSHKPVIIKSGLSKERAVGLKARLNKMGMEVSIEPIKPSEPVKPVEEEKKGSTAGLTLELVPIEESASDKAVSVDEVQADKPEQAGLSLISMEADAPAPATNVPKASDKTGFSCPSCGKEQDKSAQCVSCGVFFAKLKNAEDRDEGQDVVGHITSDPDKQSFFSDLMGSAKGLAGLAAGLGGFLFIIAKKFGLLKIIFATASLGYAYSTAIDESITMCLGDAQCETIVNETAEDCWERSGMDQYDWDAMSDSEFQQRYKELEESFFSCLTYPDGRALFLKPAYLTIILIDFCGYDEKCMTLVSHQQRICYEKNELDLHARQLSNLNQDEVFEKYSDELDGFFQCFKNEKREPLFPELHFEY